MGLIINIDEALKLRTDYNILREPLNKMLNDMQEAWEKKNPIDLFFNRSSIGTFQETFTSSIGFSSAFAETGDYSIGPIFNTAEGFSTTYRTRTFQGGFIITQQALEDKQLGKTKDDASSFIRRWHGDIVDYAITALSGAFGTSVTWGNADNGGVSTIKLTSADTADGLLDGVKNPLFCNAHTVVLRKGMTSAKFNASKQSNLFRANINLNSSDPGKIAKLADVINQVITIMENYYDDNNKRAGVNGAKVIVAPNDAHLKAALDTALSLDMFNNMGQMSGLNPAYKRATVETTPYLLDIPQGAGGVGFFIIDKAYNSQNHGLELTERVPLTLNVENTKRPYGIIYDGRQRFDINVASWRGIAYVYIGTPSATPTDWNYDGKFTTITPMPSLVTPISIVNSVESSIPTAIHMVAQLSDGSEVIIENNRLTLEQNSVLTRVVINLNVPTTLNGTPASYIVISGTKHAHGLVTLDENNPAIAYVTPSGSNGTCALTGTFNVGVPADAVRNGGIGNLETVITLTVTAAE